MAPKPLDILKKGLTKFKTVIKAHKDELNAKLTCMETISAIDDHWLDNEANTVDEEHILEALEAASDYERAVGKLDEKDKALVKKLREWAGDLARVVGNKWKHTSFRMDARVWRGCHWLFSCEGSEHEKETKVPQKKSNPPVTADVKKENATLAQRIEILDWYHKNNKNQSATAQHFQSCYPSLKIKQPLVSSWIKDEAKWQDAWERTNHKSDQSAKRVCQTEHPEVSEMMYLWVSKAMGDRIVLTGEILCQKWNMFADMVGILEDDRLKLSNGWLGCIKDRMAWRKWSDMEKQHHLLWTLLRKRGSGFRIWTRKPIISYETSTIWMKLAFFMGTHIFEFLSLLLNKNHRMAPDRGLSDRKQSGVKGKKVRLTYTFTSNANRLEKLPPFIIGKAARPSAFNKKSGA